MENVKQQIEEIREKLNKLEQQVNKPKIEVGSIVKATCNDNMIGVVTKLGEDFGNYRYIHIYGFDDNGFWIEEYKPTSDNLRIATKEEWETALTKHADKLYEGGKVSNDEPFYLNNTMKKKKAENNLFKLEGVRYSYLNYAFNNKKPLLFVDWLGSDIPKKISLLLDEIKFYNKMHRILFDESYAKNYRY